MRPTAYHTPFGRLAPLPFALAAAILAVMPDPDSTVRDRLAIRRTKLANERTLLAYIRTAVMLIASGATLWRLRPMGELDRTLGGMTILAGLIALAIGVWRFAGTRDDLADADED